MTQWSYDAEQRAGRLALDGELTVARVGAVRERLLQALDQAEQVILDLTAVTEADIAGLQLLCSACRQAAAHDRALLLAGGNTQIQMLAQAAGFGRTTPCAVDRQVPCFWARMA